jgi:predicted nucleic acid-binding protein
VSPLLAVDTNLLVYAEGEGDRLRCEAARQVMARLPAARVLLPVQVLGELYDVLTVRFRRDATLAQRAVQQWAGLYAVRESTWPALEQAMVLHRDHQLRVWDGLILATASLHRCRALLSEDLQHGFSWGGVTVVNPLQHPEHPLLRL